MLDSFNLVNKRQMVRNDVNWTNHFVLTHEKNPQYVCLNLNKLKAEGEDVFAQIIKEIYLYNE